MKKKICVGLGFAVTAMMAFASDIPTNSVPKNVMNARIESSSASVVYVPCMYQIIASCTYSVRTMLPRVKNPVLKLIICYERTDGVRYHGEAYANSTTLDWSGSFNEGIEAGSKHQTEIASSLLQRVTVKSRVTNNLSVDKGDKVIAVRTELWFDGAMLCSDNPQNKFALLKLGLPEDWYIKGKYSDKIKYSK